MKKLLAVILSCMLVLTALASCKAPKEEIIIDDANDAVADTQPETQEPEFPNVDEGNEALADKDESSDEALTESFGSVEEFLAAYPTLGDAVEESLGGEMDVKLEARENKLAYVFSTSIFDELISEYPEGISEVYSEVFGNLAPTLGQALLSMQTSIPTLEAIIIELLDSNGNVVYEDEITPEDAASYEEGLDINFEEFENGITVADYAKLLSQQEIYSDETFVVTIEARENSLVYIYTLKQQLDVTTELKASLDESYSNAEESLLPVFTALTSSVSDLESIIYEYVNADGSIIAAYEYAG